MKREIVLQVEDLYVRFPTEEGIHAAVKGVSFSLEKGEVVAFIGESGAGKSQLFSALMGILPSSGKREGVVTFPREEKRAGERRKSMAMIFQDPSQALNPYLSIGKQMQEILLVHRGCGRKEALHHSEEILHSMQIPHPGESLNRYPHQFSGGQKQRIMIAMALLCCPEILIADEPTTALDSRLQKEILELLLREAKDREIALVIITHDLGMLRKKSERTFIMYGGKIVEEGPTEELFSFPQHPYTRGLIDSILDLDLPLLQEVSAIPEIIPEPLSSSMRERENGKSSVKRGCVFYSRCMYKKEECAYVSPVHSNLSDDKAKFALCDHQKISSSHRVSCHSPSSYGQIHSLKK